MGEKRQAHPSSDAQGPHSKLGSFLVAGSPLQTSLASVLTMHNIHSLATRWCETYYAGRPPTNLLLLLHARGSGRHPSVRESPRRVCVLLKQNRLRELRQVRCRG